MKKADRRRRRVYRHVRQRKNGANFASRTRTMMRSRRCRVTGRVINGGGGRSLGLVGVDRSRTSVDAASRRNSWWRQLAVEWRCEAFAQLLNVGQLAGRYLSRRLQLRNRSRTHLERRFVGVSCSCQRDRTLDAVMMNECTRDVMQRARAVSQIVGRRA